MAHEDVRAAVRTLMESGAWPGSHPYVETFNQLADDGDITGAWSTASYELGEVEALELGRVWFEERGTIQVHALDASGLGFAATEAAMTAMRTALLEHTWPARMSVLTVGSPDVPAPGGDGLHVEGMLAVSYAYEYGGT